LVTEEDIGASKDQDHLAHEAGHAEQPPSIRLFSVGLAG
jgi:hypothetical protein